MTSYISTRGGSKPKSFTDVLMQGMAPDGGLYVPDVWPSVDHTLLTHMAGLDYADLALQMMRPFAKGSLDDAALQTALEGAYGGDAFDHRTVAPLVQIGPNAWLMELFHGPTLSFKDCALQLLGRLFDQALENGKQRLTIVGATSGDTGSAAIEACRHSRNIDIFMLHPRGRISDVQRRQMTTVNQDNVINIALDGTFDDCQAIVKALFADETLRRDLNLSAVNSINWVRITAQTVYYAAAALALGAPGRSVSFAVPTGNFGNVYAGWAAKRMGLPIERLVIGTNRNDILTRFFESGEMRMDKVEPSLSPSMDIQISSNFERYLFELAGCDPARLRPLMESFAKKKSFAVDKDLLARARQDFDAFRCTEEQTLAVMKDCYGETGILIDPHTAVGLHAAMRAAGRDPAIPVVVLATAHPSKFPDAVMKATGIAPPVPPLLSAVMTKAEHFTPIGNDVQRVKAFIRSNAGGGAGQK